MTTARVNLTVGGVDAERAGIARRQNAALAAAVAALGPGADAYGVWTLTDAEGVHPPCSVPFARRGGRTAPTAEEAFGPFLHARRPLAFEVAPPGRPAYTVHAMRFHLSCGSLAAYRPVTDDARARRAESRRRNAADRADAAWREAHPLFAGDAPQEADHA